MVSSTKMNTKFENILPQLIMFNYGWYSWERDNSLRMAFTIKYQFDYDNSL